MIKQCKTGVSEGDANFLDEMEEQDDVIYQYLIKALDFFYQNTFEYRYAMISILRVIKLESDAGQNNFLKIIQDRQLNQNI